MKPYVILFVIGLLFLHVAVDAQEKHSVGLTIGHAQGKRKTLSLPMWGLDYNYKLSHKWQLGLHTDFITETFEVEKNLEGGGHDEVVERSSPIAPAIMGLYKPNHHWGFGLGLGAEFAKEENYALTRASVE